MNPRGDGPFQVLDKINDNAYKIDLPGEYQVSSTFHVSDLSPFDAGSDSRTNPFEERGNDTTRGQTDEHRSEGLRDEDRGHDDGAEAHELGSGIREEGADAQDLGGLHVSSGPITRAKARQIQQAVESSFAGFLGQEETNSNWSLKGLTQLTCLEMVNSPSKIRVDA